MNRRGFTIFELLAVLTIIGVTLAVTLGAYNSWATAHALNSATRIVEAGLLHARTTAKTMNSYVLFVCRSRVPDSSADTNLKQVSEYYTITCTNDVDTLIGKLRGWDADVDTLLTQAFGTDSTLVPIAKQVLSRHVSVYDDVLVFCPDGGLLQWEEAERAAYALYIRTRKNFVTQEAFGTSAPLYRLILIDAATGLAAIQPRQQTGGEQNGNP